MATSTTQNDEGELRCNCCGEGLEEEGAYYLRGEVRCLDCHIGQAVELVGNRREPLTPAEKNAIAVAAREWAATLGAAQPCRHSYGTEIVRGDLVFVVDGLIVVRVSPGEFMAALREKSEARHV